MKPHTRSRVYKDGTYPRYYSCHFHKITAKRLEVLGKPRCPLPLIKADEIERQVWDEIVNTLTYGGFEVVGYQPSKLEELVGDAKYDEQITRLNDALEHQESE